MKNKLSAISVLSFTAILFLPSCVVSPPLPAEAYPYQSAPAYIAPVAPPAGVEIIAPIGVAPGPGWGWAYHPHFGWGWHHPGHGWRHQ